MKPLTYPLVHMNGTSAEGLKKDWCEAHRTLQQAYYKIRECAPHMRDYYPMADAAGKFTAARNEHDARLQRVHDIMDEYEALADEVDRQERDRR
jgi:hypothetical protein